MDGKLLSLFSFIGLICTEWLGESFKGFILKKYYSSCFGNFENIIAAQVFSQIVWFYNTSRPNSPPYFFHMWTSNYVGKDSWNHCFPTFLCQKKVFYPLRFLCQNTLFSLKQNDKFSLKKLGGKKNNFFGKLPFCIVDM